MNYYERHLGDYAKDTAHLSMIEHGAYTLLMDRYYSTEKPIPEDQTYRVTRARSKEEKQAVDAVLEEFFTIKEGTFTKGRIDEEISKVQTKIKAAQENGKKGGRPKGNPVETKVKPSGLFLGSESKTQTKALQSPVTRHHINNNDPHFISTPQGSGSEDSENPKTTIAGEIYKALKDAGLQSVSPQHPELLALIAKGVTLEQFVEAGKAAQGKRSPFAYLIGVVKGQLQDANAIDSAPGMPGKAWDTDRPSIEAMGQELGVVAWQEPTSANGFQGETFAAYTARVRAAIAAEKVEA